MYVAFTLFNILYWLLFFVPLLRHAGEPNFWRMPHLYLWISAYMLGLMYISNHYFVLEYIDLGLLGQMQIPLGMHAYILLHFMYTILGIFTIFHNKVHLKIPKLWLVAMPITYVLALLSTSSDIPYDQKYYVNTIFIYSMSVFGYMSIIRVVNKKPIANTIEGIHLMWYALFVFFWSSSYSINAFTSTINLLWSVNVTEQTGNTISYYLHGISILCIGIMMLNDDLLYKTVKPIQLWQKYRLERIRRQIAQQTSKDVTVPKLNLSKSVGLEAWLYSTAILVLDYYPFLPNDAPLKVSLSDIEDSTEQLDQIIWKIVQLRLVKDTKY